MTGVVIDPQIAGAYDDGSPDGAVRVGALTPDLVPVPLQQGMFTREFSGGSPIFANAFLQDNSDGTWSYINLSPLADPTRAGSGVLIWYPFYGRKIGVRWRSDGTSTLVDLGVMVDGVSYRVPTRQTALAGELLTAPTNVEGRQVVISDLPDGYHVAAVTVPADWSIRNQVVFFGFLLEARAGYRAPARQNMILGTGQLAVTPGATIWDITAATYFPLGARYIDYVNTATSARTVTIVDHFSSVIVWQQVLTAAGTLGCSWRYDPLAPGAWGGTGGAGRTGLYHYADVATSVNYTIWGGV